MGFVARFADAGLEGGVDLGALLGLADIGEDQFNTLGDFVLFQNGLPLGKIQGHVVCKEVADVFDLHAFVELA